MKSTEIKQMLTDFLIHLFLILLAATTVYPLLYTLAISLSSAAEAAIPGLHLYPKEISWSAYKMVLSNQEIYIGYMNTIIRTVAGTFISVIISSMFAYALSKKYLPHRRLVSFLLVFTMLFSGGTVPSYLLIKNLNLIDNRWVYILPLIISAYNVIIIRSFFESLPDSLGESAKIDGANEFIILFKIILPISKAVLATVALWVAVAHWNSWFDAMLYINDNNKQVVQILLQRIITFNNSELVKSGQVSKNMMEYNSETIKSATIIFTVLPILAVYPFVQKYFVKGVMLGAVKG